jgi:hypothetical protein
MTEWLTEEIEKDRVIVHCLEGDYEVVGSALPRFQELSEEGRRGAQAKEKRLLPRDGCIDSRHL